MPTDTEFSTLEAIVKVFEPLSYFTNELSGEKHVTASAIRPLLKHMHEKILLVSSNDCTTTKEMKMVMSNDLTVQLISKLTLMCGNTCVFLYFCQVTRTKLTCDTRVIIHVEHASSISCAALDPSSCAARL